MSESFEQWGILELMGHVRVAGRVTEEERFGAKMGRIDVPKDDGMHTQYFGGSSVYRFSPTSEEVARAAARGITAEPVHRWELPSLKTASLPPPPDEAEFGDEHEEAGHPA